jgi:hypothetical protein
MSELINAILLTNQGTRNIKLDVGMKSNTNLTPIHILKGSPEIVGAWPEMDYVLLGSSENIIDKMTNTNNNLNKFNHRDQLKGDLIVVKTNEEGDPIDLEDWK